MLASVAAMLFQAMSAKLGIVTGSNLAELCRAQFPKPVVLGMRSIRSHWRNRRGSSERA
jgi:manganese transport protein